MTPHYSDDILPEHLQIAPVVFAPNTAQQATLESTGLAYTGDRYLRLGDDGQLDIVQLVGQHAAVRYLIEADGSGVQRYYPHIAETAYEEVALTTPTRDGDLTLHGDIPPREIHFTTRQKVTIGNHIPQPWYIRLDPIEQPGNAVTILHQLFDAHPLRPTINYVHSDGSSTNYAKDYHEAIWQHDKTITANSATIALQRFADRYDALHSPERKDRLKRLKAVIHDGSHRAITFRDLDEVPARSAGYFSPSGLKATVQLLSHDEKIWKIIESDHLRDATQAELDAAEWFTAHSGPANDERLLDMLDTAVHKMLRRAEQAHTAD